MKVKNCLSNNVITVERGTPLRKIIEIFKKHVFHILPVIDSQGYIAGVITLNEITSVFQPESAQIGEILKTIPFLDTLPEPDINMEYLTPEMGILVVADEIMMSKYFTVSQDDTIARAYASMKTNGTKVLMVLDGDGKFSGIIGMFDIIYSMFREKGVVE